MDDSGNSLGYDENSDMSEGGWIQWFCSLEGHDYYAEIDEDFIRDPFNLYGVRAQIPMFDEAYEMILSPDSPDEESLQDEKFLEIYQATF